MTIKEIYTRFQIPTILQEHMLRTAKIVIYIKDYWVGPIVDWDSLTKAALLHDLGNIVRLQVGSGLNTKGEEKIQKAFRLIICRKAAANEGKILSSYFYEQLQLFQQKKLDAKATLEVGEYPVKEIADTNAFAALMKTIDTIYNMEEAITKT